MTCISVQYFALLREQAGRENEELQVTSVTYADLYRELQARHGFSLPVEMVQVAVNDEFSRMQDKICAGARVVFIPPVAGG